MNTDTKVKYTVVPHSILKKAVPVLLEEKIPFVELFLKGNYTFKIKTPSPGPPISKSTTPFWVATHFWKSQDLTHFQGKIFMWIKIL